MRRGLVGLVVGTLAVFGQPSPVWAHDGQGGSASDYRVRVAGFEGDPTGVSVTFVKLGQDIEVTRTSAREVLVLGYEGEPYLRLDNTGVSENIKSPAHFLNLDRYAATPVPADASKQATPVWLRRDSGNTAVWHDHRTHWMSPLPPPEVQSHPEVERSISGDHRVQLQVDGRPVAVLVSIEWVPRPNRTAWLALTSLGGCALVVLLDRQRRAVPACAVAATLAAVFLHGGGLAGSVFTAAAAAIAVAAAAVAALRRPVIFGIAAAIAVVFAVLRIDAFAHALVGGALPGTTARLALAVAIGAGGAVIGASMIELISPRGTARGAQRR
jgi:hypothetical protein